MSAEEDDEADLRWAILGIYRCPLLEKDGSCRNVEEQGCPFDHSAKMTDPDYSESLLSIPSYICVPHLLAECQNGKTCPLGIHIQLEEMVDLKIYELTHSLENANFFEKNPDSELECAICLELTMSEPNFQFGILEMCDHAFCGPCIKSWQKQCANGQVSCPMCRIVSDRVVYQASFVDSKSNAEEKRLLFL